MHAPIMASSLSELANELIICIIEQIDDVLTLRSLTLTSKRLQLLTEPLLYRQVNLRSGVQVTKLLRTITSCGALATAIRSIDARYHAEVFYPPELESIEQLLHASHGLLDLILQGPFSMHMVRFGPKIGGWASGLDAWMRPLFEATVLSGPAVSGPRPLQALKKRASRLSPCRSGPLVLSLLMVVTVTLDLGFSCCTDWCLAGSYASVFAHPSLEDLTILDATFPDDALELIPDGLKTPLKRLSLDRGHIGAKCLHTMLSIPHALEHLSISRCWYMYSQLLEHC